MISDYAVGADGAQSVVVRDLGFEMDGEMGLGCAVNRWLEVDLAKYTAHRPGVLYWMTQPGSDYWVGSGVGSGTWICVRPWNEWVLFRISRRSASARCRCSARATSTEAFSKKCRKCLGLQGIYPQIDER